MGDHFSSLMQGITEQQETEFIGKLSRSLLSSVVEQSKRSILPSSLHEDLFENILRDAFAKLPDSPLRTQLLTHLPKHTATLYKSYQDRIPVTLGKRDPTSFLRDTSSQKKKSKIDVGHLSTGDFPFVFSSQGLEAHLSSLQSLPYTTGNAKQYNVLIWNAFLGNKAVEAYFDLVRRSAVSYDECVARMEQIVLLIMSDTSHQLTSALARSFVVEMESLLALALTETQAVKIFGLVRQLLALSTLAMDQYAEEFFPLLTATVQLVTVSETLAQAAFSIVLQIVGPLEADRLLLVLSGVKRVTASVIHLYRHTLNLTLLNPTDTGLMNVVRTLVVAKAILPFASKGEATKWSRRLCQMDLTTATLRELSALNHTVAPEQIMSHLLDSVSLDRLHDLLEEKDQIASQAMPSQSGEGGQSEQPLFFIDTGAKSQARDIADDRSTDDSEDGDEEEEEEED